MPKLFARTIVAAMAVSLIFSGPAQMSAQSQDEAALIAKAKGIHDRVIKLDTHNDINPSQFTPECNYTMRLTTQVNLPKMNEGDMDVSFMIVYVGQGPLTPEGYENAYRQAIAKFDAVHRLTENIAPDKIGLALTAADVVALHKKGVRIAVIGVENGYPIGLEIKRVKEFYDRGGRYMSLAHNGNSQLADSNTGEAQGYLYNNALSPLGRQVKVEENDPTMVAYVVPGKSVVKHNAGKDGAAELVISGDPSNNGTKGSYLAVELSGYVAKGRSGAELPFKPISVRVAANTSTKVTAERLVAELRKNGLDGEATGMPERAFGTPRHPMKIKVWTNLAID